MPKKVGWYGYGLSAFQLARSIVQLALERGGWPPMRQNYDGSESWMLNMAHVSKISSQCFHAQVAIRAER